MLFAFFGNLTAHGEIKPNASNDSISALEDFLYQDEEIEYGIIDEPDAHIQSILIKLPLSWEKISNVSYRFLKYKNTNLPAVNALIIPKNKNGSLIIYNHGHDGLPTLDQSFAVEFINIALSQGFSISIDNMPLTGLNQPQLHKIYYMIAKGNAESTIIGKSLLQWPIIHQIYQAIDSRGNFRHFFIDGSLSTAHFLSNEKKQRNYFKREASEDIKFNNVHYVGLSGGGFAGLVSCALYSYESCTLIADFLPFKYKILDLKNWGDSEQWADSFFGKFSYEYLISLANINSKKLTFLYNSNDECCFANPAALDFKNSNPNLNIIIVQSNKHSFNPTQIFNIIVSNKK
jgi:hypothetical protein